MARSAKRSVTIPHPLLDSLEIQLQNGTLDYPSRNAAICGLLLYQAISGKEHSITSRIAHMHPHDQDAIHDFALELNRRKISLMGSFIRHVAERVAADDPEPDPDSIIRQHADQILEWSRRWQENDDEIWKEIENA